jgi:hypothetical protein
MRPRRLPAGALACLVLVAVSAGCSGSSGGSSTTATTTSATTARPATAGPGCQYIVAGTEPRSTAGGDTLQYLTSAIAEPTTCYDKVTFAFDQGGGPDLPPGYTVEYKKPPFVEGITSSTEGFKDAKYVLYIELRPVSTKDTRTVGRGITTYKGNLRLALQHLKHTVIVEWLDKAPPSVPAAGTATTTSTSTTTTTVTTLPSGKPGSKTGAKGGKGGKASGTTTTAPPSTTTTTIAPVGPTTTTTLPANDPATARVVWLIGLDSKRPFTVDASNQPSKISIIIMR